MGKRGNIARTYLLRRVCGQVKGRHVATHIGTRRQTPGGDKVAAVNVFVPPSFHTFNAVTMISGNVSVLSTTQYSSVMSVDYFEFEIQHLV